MTRYFSSELSQDGDAAGGASVFAKKSSHIKPITPV